MGDVMSEKVERNLPLLLVAVGVLLMVLPALRWLNLI